jgi:hypothetical protein
VVNPSLHQVGYRADVPNSKDVVCLGLRFGATPGQLAETLHRSSPQWSVSQWYSTILNTAAYCD